MHTTMPYLIYLPYTVFGVMGLALIYAAYIRLTRPKVQRYEGPYPVSNEKASERSLSLYGDSISVLSRLGNYMPDVTFKNWAVAGTCLTDLLVAQPAWLLKALEQQITEDPSAVVMCRYGRNDAAFKRDPALFEALLRVFVLTARANGKVPILCSLTQELFGDYDSEYRAGTINETIKRVAGTTGAHFIDVTAVPVLPGDLPDNVHPSPEYTAHVDIYIKNFLLERQIFPE